MKLEISLFRFDKNSDYLPYYTKHFLILKGEKTLLDILKRLNKEENFGFNDSPDFELVVNKKYLQASALVVDLIEKFGNEFVIEPISIVRAYKDLLISEDDFIDKFELLEEFCTSLDKEFYFIFLDIAPPNKLLKYTKEKKSKENALKKSPEKWKSAWWFKYYKFGRRKSLKPLRECLNGVQVESIEKVSENMGWLTWSDLYKNILRGLVRNLEQVKENK